jgi:predicted acetyltransferase
MAAEEDLEALKEIWRLCFGDEDDFIDFYFQSRQWKRETAILTLGGQIASMLAMIPAAMIAPNGESRPASMLYAIATRPDYRRRGYAERLIEAANDGLLSRNIAITLLVPSEEELFSFYEKLGYQAGFFIRETALSRPEIEALASRPASRPGQVQAAGTEGAVTVRPVEPAEYDRIRKNRLAGRCRIDYREEELAFEKRLAVLSGADLYAVEVGRDEGCAYAERISGEKVIVKELLISDHHALKALKRLSELLPAETYLIRTPSFSNGIPGGSIRPFGMIRINAKKDGPVDKASGSADTAAYLGIAYD